MINGVIIINRFLAKSRPEESIQEHTNNLMENYYILKKLYPNIKYLNWEILKLACLYHDLGKMNTKFQNKIMKILGYKLLKDNLEHLDEIHHSFLSPAFLPKNKLEQKFNKVELKVLYQSIYRHHDKKDMPSFEDMKTIIEEDIAQYIDRFNIRDYDLLKELDISEGLNYKYRREVKDYIIPRTDSPDAFYSYVITKGLLNKIDYAASSYVGDKRLSVEVENENLKEKVNAFFINNRFSKNDLQIYMENNEDKNNIIIASTGMGKTEASLLWIGNNKGFFTLPLRVSINAIYDRVKEETIGFENTGLLHSDTYSEYLKRSNDNSFDDYYYHQTKQMSLPLTICTLDQLVDFIFRYPGFEIKLATLAYSKLIIDEVQAYSPEFIGYLICALKFITDVGGKFSIVTATFPPIIEHFMKENKIPFIKGPEFLKSQIRHKVKVIEDIIDINMIKSNYKNKKVLVICNTVKKAQEVYKKLQEIKDTNVFLLHSRFINRDRRKLENEIKAMGKTNCKETGIWVTTQIVEASLDIDFDVLYTELSDLSGLFQRMGRVYRNRELINAQDFNVYVYVGNDKELPSGISDGDRSMIDIDIFNYSKAELLKQGDRVYDEYLKMQMIRDVYTVENLKDSRYYKKIEDTVKYILEIEEYFFEKGEQKLRDIKNLTIIPIEVYEKNKNYINDILDKIRKLTGKENRTNREIEKENLKEFFVDIPYYMVQNMKYELLKIDKYNNIMILDIKYDEKLGVINAAVGKMESDNKSDNFF